MGRKAIYVSKAFVVGKDTESTNEVISVVDIRNQAQDWRLRVWTWLGVWRERPVALGIPSAGLRSDDRGSEAALPAIICVARDKSVTLCIWSIWNKDNYFQFQDWNNRSSEDIQNLYIWLRSPILLCIQGTIEKVYC